MIFIYSANELISKVCNVLNNKSEYKGNITDIVKNKKYAFLVKINSPISSSDVSHLFLDATLYKAKLWQDIKVQVYDDNIIYHITKITIHEKLTPNAKRLLYKIAREKWSIDKVQKIFYKIEYKYNKVHILYLYFHIDDFKIRFTVSFHDNGRFARIDIKDLLKNDVDMRIDFDL